MTYHYDSLESLPTIYLQCRAFGHRWEEYVPAARRKPRIGYHYTLLCPTCSTERIENINLSGDVVQKWYIYPEDYRLPFRVRRAEAKVALAQRQRKTVYRGSDVAEVPA